LIPMLCGDDYGQWGSSVCQEGVYRAVSAPPTHAMHLSCWSQEKLQTVAIRHNSLLRAD
jgi:hypothetical protein